MKKFIIGFCCALLICWLVDYFLIEDVEESVKVEKVETPQDTLAALHPEYLPSIAMGDAAPDFSALDTAGVIHRLSDYRGKYVVLDFWATWCGDCRREMPMLLDLYNDMQGQQLKGKDVQWLGFSFDDKDAAWRNFLQKHSVPWPQVSNLKRTREDSTFIAYQLNWIPAFFLIDTEGRVAGKAITAAGLRQILEAEMKE